MPKSGTTSDWSGDTARLTALLAMVKAGLTRPVPVVRS